MLLLIFESMSILNYWSWLHGINIGFMTYIVTGLFFEFCGMMILGMSVLGFCFGIEGMLLLSFEGVSILSDWS